MDINKAIRTAVDTGKVYMGTRETLRAVANKEVKLVIVAENCPEESYQDLKRYAELSGIPVYEFKGTTIDLGAVCGRPHPVAMLGVVEAGDSDIFELGRRKE